jgi:hypothetical protein
MHHHHILLFLVIWFIVYELTTVYSSLVRDFFIAVLIYLALHLLHFV